MGASSSSGDKEEDPDLSWSPGELKYYGRAELKTSDHRYRPCNKRILGIPAGLKVTGGAVLFS